jgi:TPR repeat protein
MGTARDYYTKAAKGGLKDAEIALSRMKSQEDNQRAAERASGDKTDAQQCDRFNAFEDAPERGIRKAYFGFIDTDQALPPCLAAYKKNPKNTRIQAQLARIYFQQGRFVEGVELARSAMKDQRIAYVLLAYAYRHGIGGVQIDLVEAAKLLQQGVDRGEPESMSDLGNAYAQGKGVEKDERRALDLLQRAADTGELEAIYHLGSVRFFGRLGATKDVDEGLRLMQKSADSGLPIAQLRLGMMLAMREKRMTPEAYRYVSNAREEMERFAKQGSSWARTALGEIYERGVGVPKDPTKAFDLYRMAASHGNVTAMTRLGVAYLDGIGTEKNQTEGKQWLEKAAKMGSEAAEKRLKEVSGG